MDKKRNQLISKRSKAIVLAALSFILFYLFSYMVNPYDKWWKDYFGRPWTEVFAEWTLSLLFCILISFGSIYIHGKLNKVIPWIEKPRKRLLIETSLNIAVVVLLISAQSILIMALDGGVDDGYSELDIKEGYWHWMTISVFIALIISAIHTGDYLITNWKDADIEVTEHKLKSAEHKQAAAEAELQALKLQLDPHFVFNNLSVLSELILEDQQLGYEYAENFSKVYRYLLINSKKDLITLEEELKFLKAYIFLLEQRTGSGISFTINIDSAFNNLQLPPLTLQLLIENAMKHNKILKSNPLKINVESGEDMELIVSNSLFPLEKKAVSSGIGLHNILQRYALLSTRKPVIIAGETLFTVTIPLIKA